MIKCFVQLIDLTHVYAEKLVKRNINNCLLTYTMLFRDAGIINYYNTGHINILIQGTVNPIWSMATNIYMLMRVIIIDDNMNQNNKHKKTKTSATTTQQQHKKDRQ